MDTDRIIEALNTLPLRELRRVHAAATELIAFIETTQDPEYGRPTEPQAAAKTYRQEFVRCGKAGCKRCSTGGAGHGPYWYAYWSQGGRTRKQYLGINPPPQIEVQQRDQRQIPPTPQPGERTYTATDEGIVYIQEGTHTTQLGSFSWSYEGAGPRELARAILTTEYNDRVADIMHERFMKHVIAPLPPQAWQLTNTQIHEWLTKHTKEYQVLAAKHRS